VNDAAFECIQRYEANMLVLLENWRLKEAVYALMTFKRFQLAAAMITVSELGKTSNDVVQSTLPWQRKLRPIRDWRRAAVNKDHAIPIPSRIEIRAYQPTNRRVNHHPPEGALATEGWVHASCSDYFSQKHKGTKLFSKISMHSSSDAILHQCTAKIKQKSKP